MANTSLRELMKERGVKHWEVADALGIQESYFSKLMRYELEPDFKDKVEEAINQIVNQKKSSKLSEISGAAPIAINK